MMPIIYNAIWSVYIHVYTNQIADTKSKLMNWANHVTELRSQYQWLLFFSVPKQLLLYQLIQNWNDKNVEECLDLLLKEVMFLVTNDPITRHHLRQEIQVRKEFFREG